MFQINSPITRGPDSRPGLFYAAPALLDNAVVAIHQGADEIGDLGEFELVDPQSGRDRRRHDIGRLCQGQLAAVVSAYSAANKRKGSKIIGVAPLGEARPKIDALGIAVVSLGPPALVETPAPPFLAGFRTRRGGRRSRLWADDSKRAATILARIPGSTVRPKISRLPRGSRALCVRAARLAPHKPTDDELRLSVLSDDASFGVLRRGRAAGCSGSRRRY